MISYCISFWFLFWATVVTLATPGVGEQEDVQHSFQSHPGSAANATGRKAVHPEVFFVPSMLGLTAPVSEKDSLANFSSWTHLENWTQLGYHTYIYYFLFKMKFEQNH